MESENPYESPRSDTRPIDGALETAVGVPTWRFFLLAAIALPAIIFLFNMLVAVFRNELVARRALMNSGFAATVLCLFAAGCTLVILYWKAPAKARSTSSARRGAIIVQASIWLLSALAVPSAFVSICAPVGLALAAATRASGDAEITLAVLFGVASGVIGAFFCGRLAYNLWRDALGGFKGPWRIHDKTSDSKAPVSNNSSGTDSPPVEVDQSWPK